VGVTPGAAYAGIEALQVSADVLAATLNAVGEGITVLDPSGELILANETAASMLGFPSVAALLAAGPRQAAARFDLLDEDGGPLPLDRLPSRAALRGEDPPEMLVRWRVTESRAERFSLVHSRPVRTPSGELQLVVNVFRDVTDRQLALQALRTSEARLAFLASASRRLLTASLEPRRVLEAVAELTVPALADWCVVRELTEDGRLVKVAMGPRRPEHEALLDRLECYGDLLQNRDMMRAITAGRPIVITEVTDDMLAGAACDDEHLQLLRQLRLRSVMVVPLRTRGLTVGVLTLAASEDRPAYTDADVSLAQELAGRVAATVDNARSFATERATAATLARALLPGKLPDIPGLHLAGRYRAAGDVGGDFYDCFPVDEGTWLLVVGDVCGRGIHAASMTGLTRHTIRAAALHAAAPSDVLRDLNRLLLDAVDEGMPVWVSREQGAWPSFCTVCLAAVTPTPEGARVVISSAGHPLPFIVGGEGKVAEVAEVGRSGSLLGVMPDLDVSDVSCELKPGEALVLFTDGITERRRSGALFEEQLRATLLSLAGLPAAELAAGIEAAAVAFDTEAPADDMAVLAVSVPGEAG
jgi:sigma-B regulation protein RsbU (phosphoserine phosphatase)